MIRSVHPRRRSKPDRRGQEDGQGREDRQGGKRKGEQGGKRKGGKRMGTLWTGLLRERTSLGWKDDVG